MPDLRAFILVLLAAGGMAGQKPLRFSGEVARGREFRKEIGQGLLFALAPVNYGEGIEGWQIAVTPQTPASQDGECHEFSWIATPPYRFQNPRYVDTSYGTTAAEAVKDSPREFRFVLNCTDYRQEYKWVERLLWPYKYDRGQLDEAEAKLGKSPLGTGKLTILEAKITEGAGEQKLGRIEWLKFEVEMRLP
ncbi:MAG: hypothetical protein HYS04_09370 [Acidobacteria bacterium]|nr:hypothetical protein [Acidobacteriota bacterium]